MAANLWLIWLLSFFLAGCTALSEFLGTSGNRISQQAVETQAPFPPLPEKQGQAEACDCPPAAEPTENKLSEVSGPAKKTPGKEQIQRAQALLKVSGTDPGPLDGVMGPQTRAALQRFYSKCETLTKLVDKEISLQTTSQVTKSTALVEKNPTEDEIRKAQTLLKTSGTNPGPADGIMGSKTKTALQILHTRCATVSDLIGTPDTETVQQGPVDIQATPALPSDQQTEAVVSDPASTEPVEDESRKVKSPQEDRNLTKEEIRLVQIRLKSSGFDPGPIDGIMGPKTRSALEQELKANSEY